MQIDERHFPIVIQRIDANATPDQITRFFADMRRLADRAIREDAYYVSISVPSGAFGPLQRAKLAEEIKKSTPEQDRRSLGTFVVIQSALVRGALTAVRWMAPENLRTVTGVTTWNEALDGAAATLRKKGLRLPATFDRLRAQVPA
jgi:hypothetical protein